MNGRIDNMGVKVPGSERVRERKFQEKRYYTGYFVVRDACVKCYFLASHRLVSGVCSCWRNLCTVHHKTHSTTLLAASNQISQHFTGMFSAKDMYDKAFSFHLWTFSVKTVLQSKVQVLVG